MKNEKGYEAIIAESNRIGWPQHYRSDLEHDREILMRDDAPQEFIWILRDYGTHMHYITGNPSGDPFVKNYNYQTLSWLRSAHQVWPTVARWYIYDSNGLHETTAEKALAWAKEKIAATLVVR